MSEIKPPSSFADVVSMEQMTDPYIHTSCGNSLDGETLKSWFAMCDQKQAKRTCPRCNIVVVGMENFIINRDFKEAIEQFPKMGTCKVLMPPEPKPPPKATHINLSLSIFGPAAKDFIKSQNRWLYETHIKKDGTKEVAVDSTRCFAVILKSGKWRVYRIDRQAGAIRETEDKNNALKNIPVS